MSPSASSASRASYFELSPYSSTGNASALGAGLAGANSSSYESASYGSSFGGVADSVFAAADVNNDGVLSLSEFRNAGF